MWRKLKKAAQLPASIEISGTLRDMDSAPESQFRGLLVKLSENLNAVENPKEFENVLELLKAQNVIGKLSALARADVTTISDPPLLHATLSARATVRRKRVAEWDSAVDHEPAIAFKLAHAGGLRRNTPGEFTLAALRAVKRSS